MKYMRAATAIITYPINVTNAPIYVTGVITNNKSPCAPSKSDSMYPIFLRISFLANMKVTDKSIAIFAVDHTIFTSIISFIAALTYTPISDTINPIINKILLNSFFIIFLLMGKMTVMLAYKNIIVQIFTNVNSKFLYLI